MERGFDMSLYYDEGGIKIYHEDNIELLRRLPDRSVNLIYCDILYNTGKEFDDYSDNLGSPKEAVEWYRPRFEEMKRVLADNGSIFIHCNWRLDSYMRILMDEIFGERNFKNRIYRKHSNERGFYANFDSQVDIILYYVKDTSNFVFKEQYSSSARVVPLFENGYLEDRSEKRTFKGTEIDLEKQNKHWLVSQKQFDEMAKKGQVQLINGLPYRFSTVVPIGNLWHEDCMLDNYTRTDVAKKLKRKGIFCDINKKACCTAMMKLEGIKM